MRIHRRPENSQQDRETFLVLLAVTTAVACLFFGVYSLMRGQSTSGIVLLGIIPLSGWLIWKGDTLIGQSAAGLVLLSMIGIGLATVTWFSGNEGGAVWMLCYPLAAVAGTGFRHGIILSSLLYFFAVMVFALAKPELLQSGFGPRILLVYPLILAVASYFDRVKQVRADKAFRQNLDLERKNKELEGLLADLNQMKRTLIENEKLASLGSLVAGVAHEINTPLGNSVMVTSILMDKYSEMTRHMQAGTLSMTAFDTINTQIREAASALERNLERASDLVTSFKRLSVDEMVEETRIFGLAAYTRSLLTTHAPSFKHYRIQVELDIPESLTLRSVPGYWAHILANLIQNAVKHGCDPEVPAVIRIAARTDERGLVLEFSDTGKGMPTEVLQHIFEPFFSTAKEKGGTGLGLSILYNIVTGNLEGVIEVHSAPGKGTRFVIRVPAAKVLLPPD